jgi:hypothetical protein
VPLLPYPASEGVGPDRFIEQGSPARPVLHQTRLMESWQEGSGGFVARESSGEGMRSRRLPRSGLVQRALSDTNLVWPLTCKRVDDSMGRSRTGVCVYCGERAKVTREHVIPECLFTKPLPPNMITVGTCFKCNNGKSGDDVYLRDFLLSDMATGENASAQEIRFSQLKRSVQTNRSEIARAALKYAYRVPVRTESGLYVDSAFAVPVDGKRIESMYRKIVTGLYYHVRKTHLNRDYQFLFSHTLRSWTYREWMSMQQQGATGICKNPEIFACQYLIVDSQPMLSRWQLLFYKAILIQVFTIPATGIEALIAEYGSDQATGILPASTTDTEAGLP